MGRDSEPAPLVLHLIVNLATGGAERMLLRLLRAGGGRGLCHRVLSLTGRGTLGGDFEEAGVPVQTLGMRRGRFGAGALSSLVTAARALRPSLVVGWMYHGNLAASVAGLACHAPVVWNIRHTPGAFAGESRLTARLIRLGASVARGTAAVVYNSEASRGWHVARGYPRRRSRMVPSGLDTGEFRPCPGARAPLRAELGVDARTRLVGRVARFHPMKDHAAFLQAAQTVASRDRDVQFVLAGDGVDVDNTRLTEQVQQCGLAGRVHLLGERRDVSTLLAGLDLLCSSSAWGEGCPNVVAEAMACAVPCVVTDVGDSARLVGDTGRVVPPHDAAALSRAVSEVLGLADVERQRLGEAARERAVASYSGAAVFPRHWRLWRACLRGRAGR